MGWRVGWGRDRKKGDAVGHTREKRSKMPNELKKLDMGTTKKSSTCVHYRFHVLLY